MRFVAAAMLTQLHRNLCEQCLARELGVTVRRAVDIGRDLARTDRFSREWSTCACCRQEDVVLRHVPRTPLRAIAF